MNQKVKRFLVISCFLALTLAISAFLAASCTTIGKKETVPSQENAAAPEEQKLNVAVYYVKMTEKDAYLVREVHQVPPTKEVARAALEELINANPVSPGAARVLPAATKIKGININDGLATVDFSQEVLRANTGASGEALGIQSIVNTLTEFPEIKKVSFMVEGKVDQAAMDWWGHVGLYEQPFSRDVSVVKEPAIWVTSPASNQKVGSPLQVAGSAMVFEATVNMRLKDESGKTIAESFTTATQGAPGRGQFEKSLAFNAPSPGRGELEVFWISPKDGRELDKVVVPVNW
ncbi:Gmad2 immunoglobulin-like domain-containing protein [Pelotomaculum propionicicum]|uniref:Spore germination protein GerM n=1 Tax=Pelotomaculum propionicicum TaxID=258475 RepID=A0A4Y7RS38_9FIRM|nr:Gmad2 immunoglobulin-like domain-containing protein [Pelotomaculum propionicicum]TEB11844.1 Spore germination protein GerM [Pelotomaculum propionicicum]